MIINKERGIAFTVGDIEFYHGLYSSGGYIALIDNKEIYLSSLLCKTSRLDLIYIARRRIWEETGIYIKKNNI